MRLSNAALRNHLAELREGQGNEIACVVSHLDQHDYVCCESTVGLIRHVEAIGEELLAAREVVAAAKAWAKLHPNSLDCSALAEDLTDALDAYTRLTRGT